MLWYAKMSRFVIIRSGLRLDARAYRFIAWDFQKIRLFLVLLVLSLSVICVWSVLAVIVLAK